MSTIPPDVQKALYDETDARFWTSTGYKPGVKLDPKNPLDAKWIPTYMDLYAKVLAQYHAGTLTWTASHPVIAGLIHEAQKFGSYAADAFHRAAAVLAPASTSSPMPPAPAQIDASHAHVDEAKAHHASGAHATATAAAAQAAMDRAAHPSAPPIVVSPQLVRQASDGVMEFVMSPGGQGVQVGGPAGANVGADTVAAMQAANAPTQVANAAQAQAQACGINAPGVYPTPSPASTGGPSHRAVPYLIGGALAFVGVAFAVNTLGGGKRKRSSSRPRAPRAPLMGGLA